MTLPGWILEIEARANAATPGPWRKPEYERRIIGPNEFEIYDEGGHSDDDAEFIAHAREDIPKLIDEVRRLLEERDLEHRKWKTLALAEKLHEE